MSDWGERFSAHHYRKPEGAVVIETTGEARRYPGFALDIWPLKLVEGEILRSDGSPIEQLGYTPRLVDDTIDGTGVIVLYDCQPSRGGFAQVWVQPV